MRSLILTITEVDPQTRVPIPETRREVRLGLAAFLVGEMNFCFDIMPPISFLNEYSLAGRTERLFNGRPAVMEWEPFELTQLEYAKLLKAWCKPRGNFDRVEVPENIVTRKQFMDWAFQWRRRQPKPAKGNRGRSSTPGRGVA